MNESAAPLVDVPAASPASEHPSRVRFEPSAQQLHIWLHSDAADELDDLLDDLSEALGPDGADALRIEVDGAGTRAVVLRALLAFITGDCDRSIQAIHLAPEARDALLREAVGRAVLCLDHPPVAVRTAPPPVRPHLFIADTVLQDDALPEDAGPTEPVPLTTPPEAGAVARPDAPPHEDASDAESDADADDDVVEDPAKVEADQPGDERPAELEASEAVEGEVEAPVEPSETDAHHQAASSVEAPQSQAHEAGVPAIDPDLPTDLTIAGTFLEDLERDSAPATPISEEVPHSRPWGHTQDGDRRVLVLRRTVRSGKSVRFSGDVVIFGDVNPGAQVVADGDIVVLGRLRGLAHAGLRGDDTAVVVGLDMQSSQVRIADIIAFPRPAEQRAGTSRLVALLRRSPTTPNRSVSPSVARVVDGEIRIEDYRGRLHA